VELLEGLRRVAAVRQELDHRPAGVLEVRHVIELPIDQDLGEEGMEMV
jgi:hypothetical protein